MSRQIGRLAGILTLAMLLVAGTLAGCGKTASPEGTEFASPLPTPFLFGPLALEPGSGGVKGRLMASPQAWQGQDITVFFAAYYEGSEAQGGFYLLEPSQAPTARIDASGAFQSGALPPRRYVVFIGPNAEEALAIQEDAAPKVIEVIAGEALDLGEVSLP